MNALFRWGIKMRKQSIIWWIIGISAFIVLNLAFYPSIRNQTAQLEQSLAQIPEAARGFLSDTGEFITPTGYLSSQIFYLMLPLLLSVLAISLGTSLIGREEREGTLELLLAQPITRGRLLLGKAAVGLGVMMIVGGSAMVVILILCKAVSIPVSLGGVAFASLASLLFAVSVGAVAFLLTLYGRTRGASVGVASLFAIGGYILTSLISVASWIKWPARLFPFYYYRPGTALNGHFEWVNLFIYACIIAASGILSWIFFRRRDIG